MQQYFYFFLQTINYILHGYILYIVKYKDSLLFINNVLCSNIYLSFFFFNLIQAMLEPSLDKLELILRLELVYLQNEPSRA